MALTVGVNSYLSLVDAESYFANRIDVASWDAASQADKEKALATASIQLNNLSWLGTIANVSQALAFPRNGVYFDSMAGTYITLDPSVVPNRIINAVCEQAYHLINNDGLLDNSGSPDEIKVGTILLKGLKSTTQSIISPIAKAFYIPLISKAQPINAWWRAN